MKKDKDHAAFLLVLKRNIKQWIRQSDLSRARADLDELKQHDFLGVESRGLELEILVKENSLDEAKVLSKQLLELFPRSGRIQYLAGRICYQSKDYANALGLFEESRRLFRNWENERYLGKTQTQIGNFDDAEALLLRLTDRYPICLLDLAWLYERKEQYTRAQSLVKQYQNHYPNNDLAAQQLQRLKARVLPTDQVLSEVESLSDFDEEIPIGLLTEYIEVRLTRGESGALKTWLRPRVEGLSPKDAATLGWVCYRLKAFDLAYELLLCDFANRHSNDKYRRSLESAAQKSGQLDGLIEVYEQYAEKDRRFYGRVKNLQKRLQ